MAYSMSFNHAVRSSYQAQALQDLGFTEEEREAQTLATEVLLPGGLGVYRNLPPKNTEVRAVRGGSGHTHPGAGRKVWEAKQISRR